MSPGLKLPIPVFFSEGTVLALSRLWTPHGLSMAREGCWCCAEVVEANVAEAVTDVNGAASVTGLERERGGGTDARRWILLVRLPFAGGTLHPTSRKEPPASFSREVRSGLRESVRDGSGGRVVGL